MAGKGGVGRSARQAGNVRFGPVSDTDFPADLVTAELRLRAARAAYSSYRAGLPKRTDPLPEVTLPDGTVVPSLPGWSEEDWARERELLEAERQLAEQIHGHPYWGTLEQGKLVARKTALKQVPTPA